MRILIIWADKTSGPGWNWVELSCQLRDPKNALCSNKINSCPTLTGGTKQIAKMFELQHKFLSCKLPRQIIKFQQPSSEQAHTDHNQLSSTKSWNWKSSRLGKTSAENDQSDQSIFLISEWIWADLLSATAHGPHCKKSHIQLFFYHFMVNHQVREMTCIASLMQCAYFLISGTSSCCQCWCFCLGLFKSTTF